MLLWVSVPHPKVGSWHLRPFRVRGTFHLFCFFPAHNSECPERRDPPVRWWRALQFADARTNVVTCEPCSPTGRLHDHLPGADANSGEGVGERLAPFENS